MNFNQLATQIAKQEGKTDQETIGNIRESLRITLTVLANMPYAQVAKLLAKYQAEQKRL